MHDEMRAGDRVLFYHSNAGKDTGVAGAMEVVGEAKPDPTQFDPTSDHPDSKSDPKDPRWLGVDLKFIEKFDHLVSLAELRDDPKLEDLVILRRGNRLSVTPVEARHFEYICKLGREER